MTPNTPENHQPSGMSLGDCGEGRRAAISFSLGRISSTFLTSSDTAMAATEFRCSAWGYSTTFVPAGTATRKASAGSSWLNRVDLLINRKQFVTKPSTYSIDAEIEGNVSFDPSPPS